MQGKAKQGKARQGKAKQGKARQDTPRLKYRVEGGRGKHNSAVQYNAELR